MNEGFKEGEGIGFRSVDNCIPLGIPTPSILSSPCAIKDRKPVITDSECVHFLDRKPK